MSKKIKKSFIEWCIENNKDFYKEWHPTKNGELDPNSLPKSYPKVVWWKCSVCGYEWQTSIHSRAYNHHNCDFCSGVIPKKGINDFQTLKPEIAKLWHPTKNDKHKPHEFKPNSNFYAWWLCDKCGYEWQATINDKARQNSGCPICSGKMVKTNYNDLQTKFPEIAKQWHPTKNGNLTPDKVLPGSHKIVYWLCDKCGYEYDLEIRRKVKGIRCPICSNKKIIHGYNDAKTYFKNNNLFNLIEEFDKEKNELSLTEVSISTTKKIYWRCNKGHSFSATIRDRINGCECYRCNNKSSKLIPGKNDLETILKTKKKEYILNEWDYKKNKCSPNEIIYKTFSWYYWKCDKGHSYYQRASSRLKGENCPYCSKKNISPKFNNLEEYCKDNNCQDLLNYWDYKKNDYLKPNLFLPKSSKKAYWSCNNGHSLYMSINHVVNSYIKSKKIPCKYCSNQKVLAGYNDIATLYPDIAKQWDYSKNNNKPSEYVSGTSKKAWWICLECGKSYRRSINYQIKNSVLCYECSKKISSNKKHLTALKVSGSLKEKYPELAKQWHPTKNGNITPDKVTPNSLTNFWWICKECGYEWQTSPGNRIRKISKKGYSGCPVCNKNIFKSGVNDLQTVYPEIAKLWHPTKNGDLKPSMISAKSSKSVYWLCDICKTEWKTAVYNLTRKDSKRSKCPNCQKMTHKVISGKNDVKTYLLDNNMENVLKEWDYENNYILGILPEKICYKTGRIVWWLCSKCGKRYAMEPIRRIEFEIREQESCPNCKNRFKKITHYL